MTLRMDHAKLLYVLTSLPVSHAVLPRAKCFATSRPINHAICSLIDSSGYASGPIKICLFIDYIIKVNHALVANFKLSNMAFNAIRENKILAKIFEFIVLTLQKKIQDIYNNAEVMVHRFSFECNMYPPISIT